MMKALQDLIKKCYLKLSIIFLARYYNDIHTMPIGNFTKCLSGDLSKVSRTRFFDPSKARKLWETIFNQHLKAHGLPESYTEYLKKMTKAAVFYDHAYGGQRWKIVRARVYEAEAKQLLTEEGEKIETTCARISKFMGFPVRANECSVSEFYNYVSVMGSG